MSAPSGKTVSVNWETVDTDQPEAGVDFQAASGTLTFAPGETSKSIPITVHGDTIDEPGETYGAEWGAIALTSVVNAEFGTGWLRQLGFFLIFDDD